MQCTCLPIVKQKCPICQRNAIDGFTHPYCRGIHTIDRAVSLWNYDGIIRSAILSLKYKFATDITKELSVHIVSNLMRHPELVSWSASVPVLVPIPMHWRRKNWRGFNQVEEIGKSLSQSLSVQWEPYLLVRMKQRETQAGLHKGERIKNVQGVFSINLKSKVPSHVILFDDVYTTGATLKEACKVLKENGVKMVWVLTIARR